MPLAATPAPHPHRLGGSGPSWTTSSLVACHLNVDDAVLRRRLLLPMLMGGATSRGHQFEGERVWPCGLV